MKRIRVVKQYPIFHNRGKYAGAQSPGLTKDRCFEWSRRAVVYETQVTFGLNKELGLPASAFQAGRPLPGLGIRQVLTLDWELSDGKKPCGSLKYQIDEWFPWVGSSDITDVHRFGFIIAADCAGDGPDAVLCKFVVTVNAELSLVIAKKPGSSAPYTPSDVKTGDAAVVLGGTSTSGSGRKYKVDGQGGKTTRITEEPDPDSLEPVGKPSESTTYGYRAEIDHCRDILAPDSAKTPLGEDKPCGVPLDENGKPRKGEWKGDDWIDEPPNPEGGGATPEKRRRIIYLPDSVHLWRPLGIEIVRPRLHSVRVAEQES